MSILDLSEGNTASIQLDFFVTAYTDDRRTCTLPLICAHHIMLLATQPVGVVSF